MPALLPRISGVMQGLQGRPGGPTCCSSAFRWTPSTTRRPSSRDYAKRSAPSPDRWWFLTGPEPSIYDLIRDRFKLSVMESPSRRSRRPTRGDRPQRPSGPGRPRPGRRPVRVERPRRRSSSWSPRPAGGAPARLGRVLPTVNASLNGLVRPAPGRLDPDPRYGSRRPRRRSGESPVPSVRSRPAVVKAPSPAWCWPSSLRPVPGLLPGLSLPGRQHPVPGRGPVRSLYFTILLSHTLLATFGRPPCHPDPASRDPAADFARHARSPPSHSRSGCTSPSPAWSST